MNFLAHAYLSGEDPLVRTGNFVADAVKGSAHDRFPPAMQKGILLHRFIDHYTDHHPVVEESKKKLRERFGKYAGVVADVFYDHYLAVNWDKHHRSPLGDFINETYAILNRNFEILPDRSKQFIPFLIRQNWLGSYASKEGISDVLLRMSVRVGRPSGMERAAEELDERYDLYADHFKDFFPDLIKASEKELERLVHRFGH